jgi:hypothetical protein
VEELQQDDGREAGGGLLHGLVQVTQGWGGTSTCSAPA